MRWLLAALAAMVGCAQARAGEYPLWELGVGLGVFAFPDYRGADQGRGYVFPIPYAVYRGDLLKADRKGVRGELFASDRIDLHVSLGASLPVDSARNRAREGMPDLRPSLEIGPALEVRLWRNAEGDQLDLRLPVRLAFTIDAPPEGIGWVTTPNLNLDIVGRGALSGWRFGLLTGPTFGTQRQYGYFYTVAPEFATAERPAYEARGGYGGWQFIASASRRFDGMWIGAFLRADTLRGAVFENSPLVRRTSYVAGGLGVAWILDESRNRVEAPE
ncbi:MAG TPA: MipA/OmpV family protein [Burkholderiales bacterium]|nr:MipA/OmpV family protein [Burkholderiales bacterium]